MGARKMTILKMRSAGQSDAKIRLELEKSNLVRRPHSARAQWPFAPKQQGRSNSLGVGASEPIRCGTLGGSEPPE